MRPVFVLKSDFETSLLLFIQLLPLLVFNFQLTSIIDGDCRDCTSWWSSETRYKARQGLSIFSLIKDFKEFLLVLKIAVYHKHRQRHASRDTVAGTCHARCDCVTCQCPGVTQDVTRVTWREADRCPLQGTRWEIFLTQRHSLLPPKQQTINKTKHLQSIFNGYFIVLPANFIIYNLSSLLNSQ